MMKLKKINKLQPEFGSDSDSPASSTAADESAIKENAARLFFQILQWPRTLLPFAYLSIDDQVSGDEH